MRETRFDPPILLNMDAPANLPKKIATRRQAVALLEKLPPCGIQWCGVAACLETHKDTPTLRLAPANTLERYGFLSPDDMDSCGRWQQ